MAPSVTTLLSVPLALVSLYSAEASYVAITNLQKYEDRSEQAAKHFDKAANDLYKTRVTQASGAAAVRIYSLLCLCQCHDYFSHSHHDVLLGKNHPCSFDPRFFKTLFSNICRRFGLWLASMTILIPSRYFFPP